MNRRGFLGALLALGSAPLWARLAEAPRHMLPPAQRRLFMIPGAGRVEEITLYGTERPTENWLLRNVNGHDQKLMNLSLGPGGLLHWVSQDADIVFTEQMPLRLQVPDPCEFRIVYRKPDGKAMAYIMTRGKLDHFVAGYAPRASMVATANPPDTDEYGNTIWPEWLDSGDET